MAQDNANRPIIPIRQNAVPNKSMKSFIFCPPSGPLHVQKQELLRYHTSLHIVN